MQGKLDNRNDCVLKTLSARSWLISYFGTKMSHTKNVNMDDDNSYTGSEVSIAATDPLDDFLARYTASFNPEYCLKLRKRCGQP